MISGFYGQFLREKKIQVCADTLSKV